MQNKSFKLAGISFLLFLLSFLIITGCGKKEGTTTGDKDSKDEKKSSDNISVDKPFMVEFEIGGGNKDGKGIGTVTAIYSDKKCRTQSKMEMAGQKMTATTYFDGGDIVYIVSEIGGMKTGMKMKKDSYRNDKEKMNMTTFRDKLKEMEKVGQEEIIGKKCDIYKDKEGKYMISIYKETFPLKFSSTDGKTVMVATKFESDYKVTDDMFVAPTDVKYSDMGDMMKDMKDMKNPTDMKDKMKDMQEKVKEMQDGIKGNK